MSETFGDSISSPESQLDALVSLITSSVAQIKAEYAQAGLTAPSLSSKSSDIFQTTDTAAQAKVDRASKVLVAACTQLTSAVSRPQRTIVNMTYAFEDTAALQAVASTNIAEFLEAKPDGLHINDLSKTSGVDADKLGRILRFLAIKHIFREVSPNVFANNKVSDLLVSPAANSMILNTVNTAKAANCLSEWLKYHESKKDIKSPFHLAFGAPLMEYHNTPEGKKTVPLFMKAVASWGEFTGKVEALKAFPWETYFSASDRATVCDVGAGDGHAMLTLMKMYETYEFRAIIQDRPAFVDLSKQLWQKELPNAVSDEKVNFIPIDFFNENPVPGCDIYYVRYATACSHNWPDDRCVIILMNIAHSMRSKAGCIMLIHDVVLRHATEHDEQTASAALVDENVAPAPLLPNFGAAANAQYIADMNMLNLVNAKERTLEEFVSLGSQAGLEFVHMWDAGQTSILQFVLSS